MNTEKIPNQTETPFDTIEKKEDKPMTWAEHVKHAKELIKQKISGEKSPKKNFLLSEHATPKELKYKKDEIKRWDKDVNIDLSIEVGEMMERYAKNPNYMFGIHKSDAISGENYETDETLSKIIQQGIRNFGDASSGVFTKDPDPSKTIWPCTSTFDAIRYAKGRYKGSYCSILVAIPTEYVTKTGKLIEGKENDVYNHDKQGFSTVKPEFILGFIQNLGPGSTCKFISREELLKLPDISKPSE